MNGSSGRRRLAGVIAQRLIDEPQQRALWLKRLAARLLQQGRTDQLHLYINDIAAELQARGHHLSLEVESARKLTPAMRSSISKELRELTGTKSVSLHETVSPDLVGGFIARTPDGELDASLKHGLRKLAAIA